VHAGLAVATVAVLLCLGVANIVLRASWHEVEDGVLWAQQPEGVVAAEVAAGSAGAVAGLRPGDVLLAIDGVPIDTPAQVVEALHGGNVGTRLTYTVLRFGAREVRRLALQPVPHGNRALYFVLAAVAIFTLLVGLSVRLRRPADQATLHFFWLCVAFFGVLTFSFSGRLDRLDWFFYWADVVSILLLPPLFAHFVLVFPDRPHAWARTAVGRAFVPVLYVPALLLGGARVAALMQPPGAAPALIGNLLETIDTLELVYFAVCLTAGLVVLVRALGQVRSVTARRQLRWIVWGTALGSMPFVLGYVLPFAAGTTPVRQMELTAIPLALVPLAFASAIVRYRLLDVEIIIKRGLVYAAAISAIAAIYAVLLRVAEELVLGGSEQHNSVIAMIATLVVVLLASPVKNLIQNTLDRAYYRDRYDYRRALVAFARDLNSDLDLARLSDRLVARVVETLLVDRMALMLAPLADGDRSASFTAIRAAGFEQDEPVPPLSRTSGIGLRLSSGHSVILDDPILSHRFDPEEVAFWRERGVHAFFPCVSKRDTIAVMALGRRDSGEPLNSEDVALLTAVGGQVATALENGRLYRSLRLKADELDRLREFSDNVLESLHEGLAVVDLQDRVVRWNLPLERLYGVTREAATGQTLDALFEPGFVDAVRGARRDPSAAAALYRMTLLTRHPGGARRLLVNAATAPLRTPDGEIAGTILVLEDITTRVQLEEQLQISEKMASIGLLAAGVAHEVNTPLTGISSYTQMLLENADEADPRTKVLEKIERQTFRAAKIVNGLLTLARPAHAEAGPIDVNVVVNDVLSVLEHQLRTGNIQVRKDLASPPPIVLGIEHKLQQVFINLCLNARDAMPKGGWLSIAARIEGDHAVVEVGDTGSGIRTDHLARIYDPFFTTKALGQGTGLGLAITYGIVQEHQGAIACESTLGQGTRFVIRLPLAGQARQAADGG
jgi:PAS domain S-box-containing protein